MKTLAIVALLLLGSTAFCSPLAQEQQLRDFLRTYLKSTKSDVDTSTRYSVALAELGESKAKEVVVYVTGKWWCGSGGCLVLVLEPCDTTYKVIGRITIARPPLQVLQHQSKGWHDLAVWMQGGGIEPGHFGVFSFDGKRYPNNPSVVPSESGVPLLVEGNGTLLYQ